MTDTIATCGPDRSHYHTHTHPEDFLIDWRGYYDRFDRATAELQRFAHHERNVSFGSSQYEVMDIYYPAAADGRATTVYFMHGGGHREGHPYHYGYLAKPFIERGMIFISAGYPLMPESFFPKSVANVVGGLAWTHKNIATRGGDPNNIYIGGHSGGAMNSAHLSVRSDWQGPAGLPEDVIKGAILLSGIYDFRGAADGRTEAELAAASSVTFVTRAPARTVMAFGWPDEPSRANSDNTKYGNTGYALRDELEAVGGEVTVLPLENHDHAQVCASLADDQGPVWKAVEKMIAAGST